MSCWAKYSMRPPPPSWSSFAPSSQCRCAPVGAPERQVLTGPCAGGNGAAGAIPTIFRCGEWAPAGMMLAAAASAAYMTGMDLNSELLVRVAIALGVLSAMAAWEVLAPRRQL